MHKKRIRNLLTAVFLTGAVLGNAGSIAAEELPDAAASLSVSGISQAAEEETAEIQTEEGEEDGSTQQEVSGQTEIQDTQGSEEAASESDQGSQESASAPPDLPQEGKEEILPGEEAGTGAQKPEDDGSGDGAVGGTTADETDQGEVPEDAADKENEEIPEGIGEEIKENPEPSEDGIPDEGDKEEDPHEETGEEAAEEKEPTEQKESTEQPSDLPHLFGTGASVVRKPVIIEDFRFWTVAKVYAFAAADTAILEEKDRDAKKVGSLDKGDLCFVIHDEGDGWLYVESGEVRGFIRAVLLEVEDDEQKAEARIKKAELSDGKSDGSLYAEALEDRNENRAFAYIRATTEDVSAPKVYALPDTGTVPVFDEKSEEGVMTGTLNDGDLAYILLQEGPWCYIESGNVRGFVKSDLLRTDVDAEVSSRGEASYGSASLTLDPSENKALYYTLRSVRSGIPEGEIRESIVSYASQFIGNPYVWGGTDPVNGADCSGFVQTIYGKYGYDLPRVAADQAGAGRKVSVSEAREGDLLFYMDESGYIYHVVIYAGDGKTIEAANSQEGIIEGTVSADAC